MNNIKSILSIVFPIFFGLSIYAQNSPKTKIRLFEQTTVFDSVVSENDSIYIFAGDTVFKTQIADADWYKVGTTESPNSINDSVYTQGHVGIGTTNPIEKLVVNNGSIMMQNNAATNDQFYLYYISPSNFASLGTTSGGGIEFITGTVTPLTRMYLEPNSGNLGIGTLTPNKKLQVVGGVQMGDNGVYTDLIFETSAPLAGYNQTFDIYPRTIPGTGTSEALTYFRNASSTGTTQHDVAVDGLVGIGTAAPANQLHIAGGTNPIRLEGLQASIASDSTVLVVDPASGVVKYLNIDSIGGSDNDWFKIGTSNAPTDISDSIFTGGDLQITNYPNSRADDTTTHLNVLYTDISGNVKSARREINPPAVALNVSTVNSGNVFNYYNHYATQITNAGLNPILVGDLDFYVVYFDTAIFANVSIDALGVLTYDVIATSASHAVIDVRFYTK